MLQYEIANGNTLPQQEIGGSDKAVGDDGSDEENDEEDMPVKRSATRGSERPRLRDEKGDRKKVLRKALGLYKIYLMTKNPMPTDMADDDLADEAWFDVCDGLGINIDISDGNRTTVGFHSKFFVLNFHA